jgi:hypothetical protein
MMKSDDPVPSCAAIKRTLALFRRDPYLACVSLAGGAAHFHEKVCPINPVIAPPVIPPLRLPLARHPQEVLIKRTLALYQRDPHLACVSLAGGAVHFQENVRAAHPDQIPSGSLNSPFSAGTQSLSLVRPPAQQSNARWQSSGHERECMKTPHLNSLMFL